jgi:hypothetical protein
LHFLWDFFQKLVLHFFMGRREYVSGTISFLYPFSMILFIYSFFLSVSFQ